MNRTAGRSLDSPIAELRYRHRADDFSVGDVPPATAPILHFEGTENPSVHAAQFTSYGVISRRFDSLEHAEPVAPSWVVCSPARHSRHNHLE